MQEYYFLFSLATVWLVFAAIQDLKTTEISNWLNFSLIAFALSYRAFYSIYSKEISFFLYGLGGVAFFVILAHIFYYGRVFAGGDAKLLMGMGAVLPFEALGSYLYVGLSYVFALFLAGAAYSLIYSVILSIKNKYKFSKDFKIRLKNSKLFVVSFLILGFALSISSFILKVNYHLISLILILFPLIMLYIKSVEKTCMIRLVSAKDLMEGDWIEKDIRFANKTIKKTVHGLSNAEIKLLRKANKKVWIKAGIPFAPAFLISFLLFIYFYFGNFDLGNFSFEFNSFFAFWGFLLN